MRVVQVLEWLDKDPDLINWSRDDFMSDDGIFDEDEYNYFKKQEEEKDRGAGFYDYDSEWGYSKREDVVCYWDIKDITVDAMDSLLNLVEKYKGYIDGASEDGKHWLKMVIEDLNEQIDGRRF